MTFSGGAIGYVSMTSSPRNFTIGSKSLSSCSNGSR